MNAIETIQFNDGAKLEVIPDESPESPRSWDNNGIMVCFHRRYKLGDDHDYETPQDFIDWKDEHDDEVIACLPLYLYDHSGITMSTGPFTCPWDSGQVGWIIATREQLIKLGHDVDNLCSTEVESWLREEVKTYDQFLRGDVYGFRLLAPPITCDKCQHTVDDEEVDSCWGFYGDDPKENGISDHLPDKYRKELQEA